MLTDIGNQVLLQTKLHRPRLTADLVHRPGLKERLDRGWDRPLILVAAPAGFGKSTLLSTWLETCDHPGAWLSLDEHDNDLGVFLAYFLAAVRTVFPDALSATLALLSGVNLPSLTVIARSLLNELDALERDFVLVLDDYHLIHEQSVHELLSALLQHPPDRLHLVIATRQDPPLPLETPACAWLRSLRSEARISVSRCPRSRTFMAQTLGAPLTDEAIAVLAEKTEGWAAGLRLATLTLRYSGEINGQIARLHAENQFVMDYLMNEVLSHVPPAIHHFLLKTAILDRLCAPLCMEVIGPDSAECQPQTYLEWLDAKRNVHYGPGHPGAMVPLSPSVPGASASAAGCDNPAPMGSLPCTSGPAHGSRATGSSRRHCSTHWRARTRPRPSGWWRSTGTPC